MELHSVDNIFLTLIFVNYYGLMYQIGIILRIPNKYEKGPV